MDGRYDVGDAWDGRVILPERICDIICVAERKNDHIMFDSNNFIFEIGKFYTVMKYLNPTRRYVHWIHLRCSVLCNLGRPPSSIFQAILMRFRLLFILVIYPRDVLGPF